MILSSSYHDYIGNVSYLLFTAKGLYNHNSTFGFRWKQRNLLSPIQFPGL